MSVITLRTTKGSALTNTELDDNFQYLLTALGAGSGSTQTNPTGTGSPVLSISPSLTTPILGTPTSGTLTNCTGLPIASVTGMGTGALAFLQSPTSVNLNSLVTDNTGTGNLVFSTSPTLTTPILVTPVLGTPASGNFSTGSFTWPTFNQSTTGNAATVTNGFYTTSSFNLGTTSIPVNRASTAIVLTGITSIDGNAATVTNGVYTIGNQTITGVKTFSSSIQLPDTGFIFTNNLTTGISLQSTNIMSVKINGTSVGTFTAAGFTGNAATATSAGSAGTLTGTNAAINNIGWVPVQQGGGVGQNTNKINLGWDNVSSLLLSVDNINKGAIAMESKTIGYGQTWHQLTTAGTLPQRSSGVYYTNTYTKPIMVVAAGGMITYASNNIQSNTAAYVDSVLVGYNGVSGSASSITQVSFIVPSGSLYAVISLSGTFSVWSELY